MGHGYLVVLETVQGSEHVSEHLGVKARVDLGSASQQSRLAEAAGKHIDIGEVSCGRSVEQREEFVPASSSGASVGPASVSDAGKSGGAFTARSTRSGPSLLRISSRQNVSLS
jgi:hypothetical protein